MKLISFALCIVFVALSSPAANIHGGRIDSIGKNLLLDVSDSGGCGYHKFSLTLKGCAESFPAQCHAHLNHDTNDFCEAFISDKITLNLAANGIKGSYFSEASLTIASITGLSGDDKNNVTVFLPEMNDNDANSTELTEVTCITHTKSTLTISPEKQSIEIVTTAGEQLNYMIINTDVVSLESSPVQIQSKYSLDDGRKIVTTFTDGELTGRGYYIRIGGEASPAFECTKN